MPERFAAAIRMAETGQGGNYEAIRGLVRNEARLLGAYGVASDEWDRLAAEAGYAGARWQDARAQDMVAMAAFNTLYQKYKDWRLVATAWKAGEAVADAVAADPSLLEHKQLRGLSEYVDNVIKEVGDNPYGATPAVPGESPATPAVPSPQSENRSSLSPPVEGDPKVTESLLGVLYMMRNRQRAQVKRKEDLNL